MLDLKVATTLSRRLPFVVFGALLATLLVTPAANGALVGEFNARLKNIKLSYGGYTAVFESRIYETTGTPPPMLKSAQIHFPRGAALRREFLNSRYYCDTARLELTSDPNVCATARFASGEILLDARPDIAEAIPTDLFLFLTKPREVGAKATVAVLVVSNQRTPVYESQVLYGSLFTDSGKFGYRLVLPTTIRPLLPGLRLSLAELNLTVPGLTLTRRVKSCARKSAGTAKRCTSKSSKLFWTKVPRCTKSKKVTFAADYQFDTAAPIFRQETVKCTRFLKRPSANDKGEIPGT
ncbi:MAG: hypothetical protein WDZ37_03765 [Solirubrobacterales bacterium]